MLSNSFMEYGQTLVQLLGSAQLVPALNEMTPSTIRMTSMNISKIHFTGELDIMVVMISFT